MRFLVWLLIIASVFWGGYWFVGSRTVEKAAVSALENARDSGYSIEYSSLNTTGFPSRFDTTIKDIDIFTLAGLRWKSPFFQVFALSYKPYHIIAVWPHEQLVEYQGISAAISSSDLRASLVVKPKTTLELRRFQATGENIEAVLNNGETYGLGALSIASREGALANSHDVSVQASEIAIQSPIIPAGAFNADSVILDANLEFDAPIGRGKEPTNLTALTLNNFTLAQGDVAISVAGSLAFDQQGNASGSLTLTGRNWEAGFAILRDTGVLPEEQSNTIYTLLKGLASTSGSVDDISVPLSVKRGKVFLGFIPLGYIPSI